MTITLTWFGGLPEPWRQAEAQALPDELGYGHQCETKYGVLRPMAVPFVTPSVVLTYAVGSPTRGRGT